MVKIIHIINLEIISALSIRAILNRSGASCSASKIEAAVIPPQSNVLLAPDGTDSIANSSIDLSRKNISKTDENIQSFSKARRTSLCDARKETSQLNGQNEIQEKENPARSEATVTKINGECEATAANTENHGACGENKIRNAIELSFPAETILKHSSGQSETQEKLFPTESERSTNKNNECSNSARWFTIAVVIIVFFIITALVKLYFQHSAEDIAI
ncbi:hypothetical protein ENBRE01_0792 [Enteropsectra breve]|nr:hypothetical protein ENBRE01_0792 [Enteropsectra breve]